MADTDLRPTFESALDAFGLDATVTPPASAPVVTRALWLPHITEDLPGDGTLRRAEARRRLAIELADVPSIPRGTIVSVPEFKGQPSELWKVDEADRVDHDHFRLVVVKTT